MNTIKKIFCDIDGTLIHHDSTLKELYNSKNSIIPTNNLEKIDTLKDVEFNLASGRIGSNLEILEEKIGKKVVYKISLNGSIVYKNKEIILENTMDQQTAKEVVKYLDDNKIFYFIFTSNGIITGKKKIKNPIAKKIRSWLGVPINKQNLKAQEMIEKFPDTKIYKFSINFNTPWKDLSKLVTKLQERFPQLHSTASSSYSIDINPNSVSKGDLIKQICKDDNIDVNNVAVIGDSGNDISMFSITPYSFCMDHAKPNVLESANYIIKDVSEAIDLIKEINEKNSK